MAQIWKEKLDPTKHRDFMNGSQDGSLPVKAPADNLVEAWAYFVEVNSFTFQFISLEQIKIALEYFEKPVQPSTRGDHPPYEHNWQLWHDRLPSGLLKGTGRAKVVAALKKAWSEFSATA